MTVYFDKPTYAEVQLQVAGFIRSDVVLQPGEIDFGNVDLGTIGRTAGENHLCRPRGLEPDRRPDQRSRTCGCN